MIRFWFLVAFLKSFYLKMNKKIKILGLIEEKGISLGIHSSFNLKSIATVFVLCAAIIFSCIFVCCEASNFQEYTYSIYTLSTFILFAAIFSIFLKKNRKIFKLIENFEEIINKSESQQFQDFSKNFYLTKIVFTIQGLFIQHRRKSIKNSIHEPKNGVKSSIFCL